MTNLSLEIYLCQMSYDFNFSNELIMSSWIFNLECSLVSCVLFRLDILFCYSTESPDYCCTPYSQSTTSSKLDTSPTATPLVPDFSTNLIENCLHALQLRNHRFCPLLSFWQSFPAISVLRQTGMPMQTPTLQPRSPWLSHFLTFGSYVWNNNYYLPPRQQALCDSLFLQKQTQDIT